MNSADTADSHRKFAFISAALTFAFAVVLIALVDWRLVSSQLYEATWQYVIAAILLTLFAIWCRAIRLRVMFSLVGSKRVCDGFFSLALSHQAIFALMPSGSGDLAFPFLARRWLGIPVSSAGVFLVLSRALDLAAIAVMGGMGAIFVWSGDWRTMATLGLAFLIALAALAWSAEIVSVGLCCLRRCVERFASDRWSSWARDRALSWNDLPNLRYGIGVRLQLATCTMVIWISAAAALACALLAFDVRVTAAQAPLILVVMNLAGAASVLTFAGLGLTELGLAGILSWLGLRTGQLLALVVSVRAILLVANIVFPLVIIWIMWALRRQNASSRLKS